LAYKSWGLALSPYNDFLNLHTREGLSRKTLRLLHIYVLSEISIQEGTLYIHVMYLPLPEAAMARASLMESIFSTGAKVSL